jgi:hypothetical protein
LITSSLTLLEGHGWFLRRYDSRRALEFLNFIAALSPLTVAAFGAEELQPSKAMLRKFHDQDLTLAERSRPRHHERAPQRNLLVHRPAPRPYWKDPRRFAKVTAKPAPVLRQRSTHPIVILDLSLTTRRSALSFTPFE